MAWYYGELAWWAYAELGPKSNRLVNTKYCIEIATDWEYI